MAKKRHPRVRIVERKLGLDKAWGLYYHGENLIEIDPRQKNRKYLKTLIHELLHHSCPWMSEYMVDKTARIISEGVWRQGYKRTQK